MISNVASELVETPLSVIADATNDLPLLTDVKVSEIAETIELLSVVGKLSRSPTSALVA